MIKERNDFYEYASVEGVGEMAGWKHHENKEKSQNILDLFINEDKTFAIVLKENNKVIGSLGVEEYGMEQALSEFFDYQGREIGYVLSKDYWGKGLMPEAVKAVIDYLFNVQKLDFLTCGYYEFNNQSKKVQEKCGFKPYRKLVMETRLGTKEQGILNLLTNPNKNIKLVSNKDHTYMIYKDNNILFFNEKGLLERIQDEFGEEFVYYNEFRQIIAIKTSNLINFKYLKNIILVYNEIFSIGIFIEHKNIKIIDSLGKNVNYVVNKNVSKIMLKDKDILLKYDKLSRINLIKEISNNIIRDTNIKYEYLKTIVKKNNNKVWLRQVIVPGINDNTEYIYSGKTGSVVYTVNIPVAGYYNILLDYVPYTSTEEMKASNKTIDEINILNASLKAMNIACTNVIKKANKKNILKN